jgi:hypothetical protein
MINQAVFDSKPAGSKLVLAGVVEDLKVPGINNRVGEPVM